MLLARALILAAVCVTTAPASAGPAILAGVATVHDGDTLTIGGVAVRLKGISAPELGEPGGIAARDALRALVGDRVVRCRLTGETTHRRAVGFCKVGRRDLQAALVRAGLAMACPRFDRRYVPLEVRPRAAGTGVWGNGYARPGYCAPRPRPAGAR